jgi:hypothetical protein
MILSNTAFRTSSVRLAGLEALGHHDLLEDYRSASATVATLEAAVIQPGKRGQDTDVHQLERAHSRIDTIVAQIRSVPGFQDFPLPSFPEAGEIASLPAPCVFLVPGLLGGAALRIDADGGTSWRPLPDATEAATAGQAALWRAAAPNLNRSPRSVACTAQLRRLGAWMWGAAMEVVVRMLEATGDNEAILIPCGAFVDMPLHAAWRAAPTGERFLVDDVTISYSPSLRAALDAQSRAATEAASLLALADASLSHARREVDGVMAVFGGPARSRSQLLRSETTHSQLLAALPGAHVVHFACHGRAEPENALNGAIYSCRDAPITLGELIELDLQTTRLAVLSACETAVSDIRLPNEVVNLASGMLQAGAAGAIGSLWPVNDATTAALMQRFYEAWRVERLTPARALRAAQQWMRSGGAGIAEYVDPATDATRPVYWAPFVFVGA